MKPFFRKQQTVLIVIALCFSASAFAAPPLAAVYDRGSGSIRAGSAGTLDISSPTELVFHASAPNDTLTIPYKSIEGFNYRREVVHHLGVLPAIVVTLFLPRPRHHFFTIKYTDASSNKQVAVFEVSKRDPRLLLPLLRARTGVCGANTYDCGGSQDFHVFE